MLPIVCSAVPEELFVVMERVLGLIVCSVSVGTEAGVAAVSVV